MAVQPVTKKVALASALSALGIVISPLFFEWLGTRAFPGQHFINVLSGVLLGPVWGAVVAVIIGSVRIGIGTGTVFAYPGSVPGVLLVGTVYLLLQHLNLTKLKFFAAFAEPVGTVFIGGTIALTIVAPYIGPTIGPAATMLRNLEALGFIHALFLLWGGWAVSSVIGAAAGFFFLLAAERYGVITKAVTATRQKS